MRFHEKKLLVAKFKCSKTFDCIDDAREYSVKQGDVFPDDALGEIMFGNFFITRNPPNPMSRKGSYSLRFIGRDGFESIISHACAEKTLGMLNSKIHGINHRLQNDKIKLICEQDQRLWEASFHFRDSRWLRERKKTFQAEYQIWLTDQLNG